MAPKKFTLGKVPPQYLEEIVFKNIGVHNSNVILGPKIGEDAAVIKLESSKIVIAADPITGSIKDIGKLVVHVNANDIATHGAKPRWMLLTILLPKGSEPKDLEEIMVQVHQTANSIGISIVGGHTEITQAVTQPIVCGTMFGELNSSKVIMTGGAQIGDHILLTKGAGLEGTTILASEKKDLLLKKGNWSPAQIESAQQIQKDLSILLDTEIAVNFSNVTAMHDPTEGGIAGALHELANASEKGFRVFKEKIPISETTTRICEFFNIDPLTLISSGALLLTVPPEDTKHLLEKYKANGILASDIGVILPDSSRREIVDKTGDVQNLIFPHQDALWEALNKKG